MQVKTLQAEPKEALDALFQTLQLTGVRVNQPDEVRDYLGQHPDLIQVVAHAAQKTRDAFPDATLLLQLYHDPEIEEETSLTLLIRSTSYPPDFWGRLVSLRAQEIEPFYGHCEGFHLTTDFGLP